MNFPAGYQLFASGVDDDYSIAAAKEYIKRYGLTREDVKLVRRNGMVILETVRPVTLSEKV